MKAKTETLTGQALIWATCLALRHSPVVAATGVAYRSDHGSWVYPRYTSDQEVGELMSSEWIGVERPSRGQKTPVWRAITESKIPTKPYETCGGVVSAFGVTLGEAVCRVLVISRLGAFVEVPDELLPVSCPQP